MGKCLVSQYTSEPEWFQVCVLLGASLLHSLSQVQLMDISLYLKRAVTGLRTRELETDLLSPTEASEGSDGNGELDAGTWANLPLSQV